MVAGGQLGERLAHLDVAVVRRDHEAGVRERRDLLLHAADDRGRGVADRDHRDAGAEVDQRVAVDVDEHAAAGGVDEDRQRRADPVGDVRLLAVEPLERAGAGDLGDEAALLGQGRAAGVLVGGHGASLGHRDAIVATESWSCDP